MRKHCRRRKHVFHAGVLAGLSTLWLLFRTGSKPSRIVYPCQRAAMANVHIFLLTLSAPLVDIRSAYAIFKQAPSRAPLHRLIKSILLLSCLLMSSGSTIFSTSRLWSETYYAVPVSLDLESQSAVVSTASSDLFFVENASGSNGDLDSAISALFSLVQSHNLSFFKTTSQPTGLIANDDVVLIKVNAVGPKRAGTNTDLLKSIIKEILGHPDGFAGEIVVADNGQSIGCLDRAENNAYDHSQSMQDVVNAFPSSKVSAWSWYTVSSTVVDEYKDGDMDDGYVVNSTENPDTRVRVSYPKFTTKFGTHISFKHGIWNSTINSYNSTKLKVINVPILKSHSGYGVTACIKNYMGVVSQTLTDTHSRIKYGALGTAIAETRFPTLNIIDAIWVNPNPKESGGKCGPMTSYEAAGFTNVIGASQDPVALEYWASKNILIPAAINKGYTSYSSLDPDYEPITPGLTESYHNYLEKSMKELEKANHQVTMNQAEMNVYVTSKASSDVYQGDLRLKGSNVTIIEGRFDINGSIIVEENATLILRNAVLNFAQSQSYQFHMNIQNPLNGNPRLIIENATMTSSYMLYVRSYGNSSIIGNRLLSTTEIHFSAHDDSVISLSNSRLHELHAYDSSLLTTSDSYFDRLIGEEYSNVTAVNSTLVTLHARDNACFIIMDCMIPHDIISEVYSVNCSINELQSGFVNHWNLGLNSSVIVTPAGWIPNITLFNTEVYGWSFILRGVSAVTISNCELMRLDSHDSVLASVRKSKNHGWIASKDTSSCHIYDTTVNILESHNNATVWLFNSTYDDAHLQGSGKVHISWYLEVHVIDQISQDVPSANVTAFLSSPILFNQSMYESELTDANGLARLKLIEKIMNTTGQYSAGNYTVEATYETHSINKSVEITDNKQITLRIVDFVIPEVPPFLILPLFIVAAILTIIISRRWLGWPSQLCSRKH